MNISFLLIGGNEEGPRVQLAQAGKMIEAAGCRILRRSALYETAPWGKANQPDFLNQALQIETLLEAPALMDILLEIEKKMGRVRLEKYGSRIIDIDMLFFNEEIIHSARLLIPHPEIPNRRFVLVPMEEIAPDHCHPVLRRTIRELLAACPDKGEVHRLKSD